MYLALFFVAPESKHRSMISFCLSVNLTVFLFLASRLWAPPFNSRANCFCFCSKTCSGSFLIDCSLILLSVFCRAELADLCARRLTFQSAGLGLFEGFQCAKTFYLILHIASMSCFYCSGLYCSFSLVLQ